LKHLNIRKWRISPIAQIETFVKKWFVKEPIKCEKFLTEFKQEQYRGLRELASSPLLLGMVCLAFADTMEFTTRRVDIYEDAIDALLRKWDTSRSISRDVIYHGLTHQLKKRLFTNIAYKTFSSNQYLIEEPKLVSDLIYCLKQLPNPNNQELDGEVVLKAIEAQHGIFVERSQKLHSFAHLTFQEYFAACAIKGNVNYQKELMQHITDPRWREVFLLTASLLDDADEFFEFI
jgi:predicted NACHT family NTPase